MKVSKVDKIRVAVGKNIGTVAARGMLYKLGEESDGNSVEQIVLERVENANKLYSVFFRSNYPKELMGHFKAIVEEVRNSGKDAGRVLKDYRGYTEEKWNGKKWNYSVDRMFFKPAGKDLKNILQLYVREKLSNNWQAEEQMNAAVEVLSCLCRGEYFAENVENLSGPTLAAFEKGCFGRNRFTFARETGALEKMFTYILQAVAVSEHEVYTKQSSEQQREEALERQLDLLIHIKVSEIKDILRPYRRNIDKEEISEISSFYYADASYPRMEAIVVRMRRSLKKGKLKETAIELLLALSKGSTWTEELNAMLANPEKKKQLLKFICEVNKDYYHLNVLKSVQNTEVAVCGAEDGTLSLSNARKEKKQGLQDTLLQYASSMDKSNEVLLRMKKLLLTYFLGNMEKEENRLLKEKLLTVDTLWNFRGVGKELFDAGFISDEAIEKENAATPLMVLFADRDGVYNQKKIAERISYVNYGLYLRLKKNCTGGLERYWCDYIKEYVEQNYVTRIRDTKQAGVLKVLIEGECTTEAMLKKCWHEMISHVCGKYMDVGKAVYHFVLSDVETKSKTVCIDSMNGRYQNGITSFDYEIIKAEENLKKSKSDVLVSAIANFSRSVADYEGEKAEALRKELETEAEKSREQGDENRIRPLKEDILVVDKDHLERIMYHNSKKNLLRYFGGASTCATEELERLQGIDLAEEFRQILRGLRNLAFHYTDGEEKKPEYKATKELWKLDLQANRQLVLKKYYSTNVCSYYSGNLVKDFVEKMYISHLEQEAQIPAFRSVWKKKELSAYISTLPGVPEKIKNNVKERARFEAAMYFLMKEIYYRDFCAPKEALRDREKEEKVLAADYFFDAVERYFMEQNLEDDSFRKGLYANQAKSFWMYVRALKDSYESGEITFGGVCQTIMNEYSQQNAKQQKKEKIYQHFNLLFPMCMQAGFRRYVEERYGYLLEPDIIQEVKAEERILEDAEIKCFDDLDREASDEEYSWYVLAHFIHPVKLNHFTGALKDYLQFKHDILRRSRYAKVYSEEQFKQLEEEFEEKKKEILCQLRVLEFVRNMVGRISDTFEDYYEDNEDYARYMNNYIAFEQREGMSCYESFREFCNSVSMKDTVVEVYTDAKNPKLLRNVEISRMYAGGNVPLHERKAVTAEELKRYYENELGVQRILQSGLCGTEKEQRRQREQVVYHQYLKNRITLNDVTVIQEMISELLSRLVTFSYYRERDEMYLLLGFYYMALQADKGSGWQEDAMDDYKGSRVNAGHGFVLHQALSVFTYGMSIYYYDAAGGKEQKAGGQFSAKLSAFEKMHKNSLACALRLFMDDKRNEKIIRDARNYVDHFKYYAKSDRSIMDLYSVYYEYFFGYSTKLRKSVLSNFKSVLEQYFVDATIDLNNIGGECAVTMKQLKSELFTYKLSAANNRTGKVKTVKQPARDEVFLANLKAELEYKEEKK